MYKVLDLFHTVTFYSPA